MKKHLFTIILWILIAVVAQKIWAQTGNIPDEAYQKVLTYVDPVLSGAHPDMTLMRLGDNFYMAGSSFHLTPYLPIYHSTDLVHWQIISRVVAPGWTGYINDTPSGGIWQGGLAEFGGFYWVYYSINSQQYFSKATSMQGPWSAPTRVTATTVTGYDNSVFVDDNGTPYMLMKNGKFINRIQAIDPRTGQLTGPLLNLDWINVTEKYSWAEGPKMCKRNGWYYYFIAGNVGGGQWVLRTPEITEDKSQWEEMGQFFASITDASASFRGPNHLTQPIELNDGTWWALSHSFQSLGSDSWEGKGRQGLLHRVIWDDKGKPTGTAPTSKPQLKPNLPKSGIPWSLPRSDYFDDSSLKLTWHFLNRTAASRYSLTERSGWLTLNPPAAGKTHLLHKEGGYYFTLTTKVDFDATANGHEAGLYLTNGNESVTSRVYSGFNNGKKIGFTFSDTQSSQETKFEIDNTLGNVLWLKVERDYHNIKGYYSSNGIEWIQIGNQISSLNLDKAQPNYNWWVGTSNGLLASGKKAQFDHYLYRDGFFGMRALGHNNFFGVEPRGSGVNRGMSNTTSKGGWLMLAGVELGRGERVPASVTVDAASTLGGVLEIWIDDLEEDGTKIAEIAISNTGGANSWKSFSAEVLKVSGQHDLFLRWSGPPNAFIIRSIKFNLDNPTLSYRDETSPFQTPYVWKVYPNPVQQSLTIESDYPDNNYQIYNLQRVLIKSGRFAGSTEQKIDLEGLPPGIYILELVSGNKREVFKLSKINQVVN